MRTFLSAIAFAAFVWSAQAGPKEDAYRVVANWVVAFTNADVDAISKLYAPDALMIGTLRKTVMSKPEEIRRYADAALNADKAPHCHPRQLGGSADRP